MEKSGKFALRAGHDKSILSLREAISESLFASAREA
jgi:hypothetical protein